MIMSSLDKLKALTSKIDNKLAEKKSTSSAQSATLRAEAVIVSDSIPTSKLSVDAVEKPIERPVIKPAPPHEAKATEEQKNETIREINMVRIKWLFQELKIFEKSPDFDMIFMYKAMNLSGIGLKEEDFGETRAGKYIQIIAITYEPDDSGKKKAKNISLGYFGKGESLDPSLKNLIIEFILRWRYEKALQNVEHYKDLLSRLERRTTLF